MNTTPRPTNMQIIIAMQAHKLKPAAVAAGLDVTVNTVYEWTSGRRRSAPYILDAISALAAGLKPATPADTQARWVQLGVTRQHSHNWKRNGSTPLAAQLAAAWVMKNG